VSREELLTIFAEDVPPGYMRDMINLLSASYPRSYTEAYGMFGPNEAHDVLGMIRRARIEEGSREIAARYPNMIATVQTNRKRSQYYTEIRSGRVVMTTSCLTYPQSALRRAEFRKELNLRGQLVLDGFEDERQHKPGTVFAVIAHGPQNIPRDDDAPWEGELPKLDWSGLGFAFAGFPDGVGYWAARMDLLAGVGVSVDTRSVEAEEIEDRIDLQLRSKPKAGQSGA